MTIRHLDLTRARAFSPGTRELIVSRLDIRFASLASDGRKALNTYIVAGDPAPEVTVPAMHALVRGGADLIELGVPFSDPEAEGPAIQAGIERALAHNVTLGDVLDMMSAFRNDDRDTPVVLMGYLNPFLRMGYEAFCKRAADAGVDGVIVVNLPPEEAGTFQKRAPLSLAWTWFCWSRRRRRAQRTAYIAGQGSGFLYYVSYKGCDRCTPRRCPSGRQASHRRPCRSPWAARAGGVRDQGRRVCRGHRSACRRRRRGQRVGRDHGVHGRWGHPGPPASAGSRDSGRLGLVRTPPARRLMERYVLETRPESGFLGCGQG